MTGMAEANLSQVVKETYHSPKIATLTCETCGEEVSGRFRHFRISCHRDVEERFSEAYDRIVYYPASDIQHDWDVEVVRECPCGAFVSAQEKGTGLAEFVRRFGGKVPPGGE